MPTIIIGNQSPSLDYLNVEYNDYDYPEGLDLRPKSGNDSHKRIVDNVMKKARMSHGVISNRYSAWEDIDKFLVGYIRPDEKEQEVKEKDDRKPISIVFPYTYAVMETLLAYLSLAHFQDPIFRYEGSSPEDTIGAILLEKVVQKHCQKNKVELSLHTMFRDCLSKGIGPVAPAWDVRRGTRNVMREEGRFSGTFNRLIGRKPVREEREAVLFEGNTLNNISPYNVLPDPSVSAHDIQKGEFFGWVEETNLSELLRREQEDEDYFNCRYLKHVRGRKVDILSRTERPTDTIPPDGMGDETNNIEIVHMYLDLIPSDEEWQIGDNEYPEKWLFSVAAGCVVVQAKPLGLNHGMYPVTMAAPTFDGYSISPISKLETLHGLQETLNWLFNSHIANVRKAVNDMLVVDPYMLNINDLKDPGPGKLIRMRRPAWGRGVRDAVMQLQVTDVTRQNISDSAWILSWMNNIVGSDESMMGSLRQSGPERLTRGEFEGTRQSAMSRLQYIGKLVGVQALQDIAYFFASHTQQLMSEDTYVKTVGEWEDRLKSEFGPLAQQGKMKVSPSDLLIDYDVELRDGSIPNDDSLQFFSEVFQTIAEHPELNQEFDIKRVFKHIARSRGVKNVREFYRNPEGTQQPQIMQNEEVQREVERGNLIPNT